MNIKTNLSAITNVECKATVSVETEHSEIQTSSTGVSYECAQEKKEVWNLDFYNGEPLSRKWKKPTETMSIVQNFLRDGLTPKEVLTHILPHYTIPESMTDEFAVQIILEMFNEKQIRERITNYNTFEHAVELFKTKKNILVLTGAGVSVSCGIPDFRSATGIYARLHKDFPELPDPTAMFDIDFFRSNPSPFYNFAKEIFPGQFKPSVSHMFIRFLEQSGRLLRNYTQNIDTLENIAGIQRVVECHGSFARSTCLNCKSEVDSTEIKDDVLSQKVAYCKKCGTGVLKPNIVFFGEDLGEKFHNQMGEDHDKVDLLVVIGSSLKVQPVALIPFNIDPKVPQILINREQLPRYQSDIVLLGNCDDIIISLCMALGDEFKTKMLTELKSRPDQFSSYLSTLRQNQADIFLPEMPRVILVDEFKKIISEPPAKRARQFKPASSQEPSSSLNLKEAKLKNEDETLSDSNEVLWESNYVAVSDILSCNSLLFVLPNINAFKGAEMFYERDNDTFCRQPGPVVNRPYNDDDDLENDNCSSSTSKKSSDSEIDDYFDDYYRPNSVPPNSKFYDNIIKGDTNFVMENHQTQKKRASSCPTDVDIVQEKNVECWPTDAYNAFKS